MESSPTPMLSPSTVDRVAQPALRRALLVALGMVIFLAPWSLLLAESLPTTTRAWDWNVAWTGLDVAEAVAALLTAVLLARRDERGRLAAAAGATLLFVDAWFDVCTSAPGLGRLLAIAMAFVEVSLAAGGMWLATTPWTRTDLRSG